MLSFLVSLTAALAAAAAAAAAASAAASDVTSCLPEWTVCSYADKETLVRNKKVLLNKLIGGALCELFRASAARALSAG